MRRDRVLIVEGEKENCGLLRDYVEDKGYEVATAGTCALAEQGWRATWPDIAILNYSLPDGNAPELIPRLKAIDASIPIIILTGYGSIDLAVEAVKLGAEYFLPKPADLSTLHVMVQRSLENQRNRRQQLAKKTMSNRGIQNPFLGENDSIRRLADLAHRAASNDTPVLIQGETGTGKGMMARWLHQNGPRASEPFVDMNCGGSSRSLLEAELFGDDQDDAAGTLQSKAGLLEAAHKGTVFLEGIENVNSQIQPKLMKVVEEKQFRRLGEVCDRRVDVRLIAATRQVMAQPVLRKQFRGDLYYRIGWIPLCVPPLRERVEDIPILSAHILGEVAADLGTGGLELGAAALRAHPTTIGARAATLHHPRQPRVARRQDEPGERGLRRVGADRRHLSCRRWCGACIRRSPRNDGRSEHLAAAALRLAAAERDRRQRQRPDRGLRDDQRCTARFPADAPALIRRHSTVLLAADADPLFHA